MAEKNKAISPPETEGEALKRAIKKNGLTIQEAADLLNISRPNLHFYLKKTILDNDFKAKVLRDLKINVYSELSIWAKVRSSFLDTFSTDTDSVPKKNEQNYKEEKNTAMDSALIEIKAIQMEIAGLLKRLDNLERKIFLPND